MKLEVCIDRLESALAAKAGGADRVEVCGTLRVRGITPSCGLVEGCLGLGGIEVVVMIRPHDGRFCYESPDIQLMIRDIQIAKDLGAQGVEFGHSSGTVESIMNSAADYAIRLVPSRSRFIARYEPNICPLAG